MNNTGIYKLMALLVIILLLSYSSHSQTKDNYLIYSSEGGTIGNYIGGGITLDVIRNNKYSLGMGYFEQEKNPGNLPSDYEKGIFSLFTFGLNGVRDNIKTASFTFGKVFYNKSNSRIRYNIKAGITYSVIKTPTNWVWHNYGLFSNENYTYDYKKNHVIGVLINPTIEFPLLKFLGFSAGPYVFINPRTVSYGMELSYLMGYVRK